MLNCEPRWVLYLLLMVVAGCASAPSVVTTPVLLEGRVTGAEYTGWDRDICGTGRPSKDRYGDASCVPFGGEYFRSAFFAHSDVDGARVGQKLTIAYPGHALATVNFRGWLFLLSSPDDFREETGIAYIAAGVGVYDPEAGCVRPREAVHVAYDRCPDWEWHERHAESCLPVDVFLEHFVGESVE
ncbi:MAG: hypothetical protein AAF574_14590 [Pseudomonadota bacterium]